jgi:hypothetical protein
MLEEQQAQAIDVSDLCEIAGRPLCRELKTEQQHTPAGVLRKPKRPWQARIRSNSPGVKEMTEASQATDPEQIETTTLNKNKIVPSPQSNSTIRSRHPKEYSALTSVGESSCVFSLSRTQRVHKAQQLSPPVPQLSEYAPDSPRSVSSHSRLLSTRECTKLRQ